MRGGRPRDAAGVLQPIPNEKEGESELHGELETRKKAYSSLLHLLPRQLLHNSNGLTLRPEPGVDGDVRDMELLYVVVDVLLSGRACA